MWMKFKKSLEMSSDGEDEPMNKWNGNLIYSPVESCTPQERLDPSLMSAIKEATLKLVELSEGNSISIRMFEFNVSHSPSSNVPSVGDNLLESYLVGDSTTCIENVSTIDNCSSSSPVKTSKVVDECNQLSAVGNLQKTNTNIKVTD